MLILVRHGRTEANAAGLLLGRADPPLDDTGRAQVAQLAAAVPNVTRVVCSPLARARATAEVFGVPVTVDDRWIELDYGSWDGMRAVDIPRDHWLTWRGDPNFRPAGGESLRELGRRVRRACGALAEEAAEHDVVVVSHVSPIKAAVAWALETGDDVAWRLFLSPASITRIATAGGGRSLHTFNETAHLR